MYGPGEAAPAGAAGVVDAEGRIHAAYEPGAAGTVVVVRPDHHLGTVAPASAPERVRAYLALLCGGAQAPLARG